jgi:hypothetical protein
MGCIDHESICGQSGGPDQKRNAPAHPGRPIEGFLHAGSIYFQKSSQQENKQGGRALRDDEITKFLIA